MTKEEIVNVKCVHNVSSGHFKSYMYVMFKNSLSHVSSSQSLQRYSQWTHLMKPDDEGPQLQWLEYVKVKHAKMSQVPIQYLKSQP